MLAPAQPRRVRFLEYEHPRRDRIRGRPEEEEPMRSEEERANRGGEMSGEASVDPEASPGAMATGSASRDLRVVWRVVSRPPGTRYGLGTRCERGRIWLVAWRLGRRRTGDRSRVDGVAF